QVDGLEALTEQIALELQLREERVDVPPVFPVPPDDGHEVAVATPRRAERQVDIEMPRAGHDVRGHALPLCGLVQVQHRQEPLLRNLDASDRFHALLARLLLLEQLPLACDVAAVALR